MRITRCEAAWIGLAASMAVLLGGSDGAAAVPESISEVGEGVTPGVRPGVTSEESAAEPSVDAGEVGVPGRIVIVGIDPQGRRTVSTESVQGRVVYCMPSQPDSAATTTWNGATAK